MNKKFDLLRYLRSIGISPITRGKNISRNDIGLKCCFCSDPSTHLVVHKESKIWQCWRCGAKGKLWNLICALEKITPMEASRRIAEFQEIEFTPESYRNEEKEIKEEVKVELSPSVFYKVGNTNPSSVPFPQDLDNLSQVEIFLQHHGWNKELINRMDLRYANYGPWMGRLIFPIYSGGKLLTFQSRDLTGQAKVKYKAFPESLSVLPMNHCLYDYDYLLEKEVKIIVLVEGPLDFGITWQYYNPKGIGVTCVFGSRISIEQLRLIVGLNPSEIWMLLDSDLPISHLVNEATKFMPYVDRVKILRMPEGYNDPGDASLEVLSELRDVVSLS